MLFARLSIIQCHPDSEWPQLDPELWRHFLVDKPLIQFMWKLQYHCFSAHQIPMVIGFQWWPRWRANGNSTKIMKDDISASLRYCTVPFIIFTSFWLMYRPRPSLETPWLWWNISWTKSSGIPGAGWVILRYNCSKSTALFLFFI